MVNDTAELSASIKWDADVIDKLLALRNDSLCTVGFTVSRDVEVPARKHKKKRIQKKWIKRHGFRTIERRIPCTICGVDLEVENIG